MKKKYLVLKIEKDSKKDWINKWLKPSQTEDLMNFLTDEFFYEDIYKYNKNEYFIDITNYEELYQKSTYQIALDLKNKITNKYKMAVRIGLGTNLFLAKTACDIITIKKNIKIAYLDEKEFIITCSKHTPLTDFWQISNSMMLKLNKLGIKNMEDIRDYSYQKLYEIFGLNAEYLINHSLGVEGTTIKTLRTKSLPRAISSSITFKSIKTKRESLNELQKLLDFNILKLKEDNLKTKTIYLYIKYAKNITPRQTITIKLREEVSSYLYLMKIIMDAYKEKSNDFFPIEKLAISFCDIKKQENKTYLNKANTKNLKNYLPRIIYKKHLPLTSPKKVTFLQI